ncbi:MAG: thiamine pyrophosphate-dependent enzyme [Gammaproteobacteria bacterium]|nr:thiamine pyrophosphate-dependent enzyme [Gammaproteobacteria bacterium]
MTHIDIDYVRFIDRDGVAVTRPPEFANIRDTMIALYRAMVFTRAFDARAVALQRTGRLGTYASSLGQEATAVGIGHAMAADDVFLPSFREQGAQLVRGVTAKEILMYWGGDERGSDFAACRHDFPVCIPVGSHAPHAAGVALALKLDGGSRAALAAFGDGATSRGDFYEAMNVAGVWSLPVVFVAVNNGWAISVPRSAQTAARTSPRRPSPRASKASRWTATTSSPCATSSPRPPRRRAREGGGPTSVEALTYRLGDHTTVDDASRYRDDDEVAEHWTDDPVARTREWLTRAHGWSRDDEAALIESCESEVEQAVEAYLAEPAQVPESMFDFVHAKVPAALARQRRAFPEGS